MFSIYFRIFHQRYRCVSQSFSIFEVLLCILILSIVALFIVKPYIQEAIAIRQASTHIQMLQQKINEIVYIAFLQKSNLDDSIKQLLEHAQIHNNFFSLVLKNNVFTLRIRNKQLRLTLKPTPNSSYVITCNPSQILCRKLYHRKHAK